MNREDMIDNMDKIISNVERHTSKFKLHHFVLNPIDFPGEVSRYIQISAELRARKNRLINELYNLGELKLDLEEAEYLHDAIVAKDKLDEINKKRYQIKIDRIKYSIEKSEELISSIEKESIAFIDMANTTYNSIDKRLKNEDGSLNKELSDAVMWIVKQSIAQTSNPKMMPFGFHIVPKEVAEKISATVLKDSLESRQKELIESSEPERMIGDY